MQSSISNLLKDIAKTGESFRQKNLILTDVYIDEEENIRYASLKDIMAIGRKITKEEIEALDSLFQNDEVSVGASYENNLFFRITRKVDAFNKKTFTIRVLYKDLLNLETIAEVEYKNALKRFMQKEDFAGGLVLVVGSTGSGKSTLIYSSLKEIAKNKGVLINTYENPVEIYLKDENLKGVIRQYEERNYKNILYHFLQSSPKIGYVTEVKTSEEIEDVIDLSSRGHLIFTSLHANNVFEAIKLVASSVSSLSLVKFAQTLYMIVAVRLIRYKNQVFQIQEILVPNNFIRRAIENKEFSDIKRYFYTEPNEKKAINEFALRFSSSLKRKINDIEFINNYKKANYFIFEDEKR